jgi:Glucose-repressible protein Grg1
MKIHTLDVHDGERSRKRGTSGVDASSGSPSRVLIQDSGSDLTLFLPQTAEPPSLNSFTMQTVKDAANFVTEKAQELTAGASKETNSEHSSSTSARL